MTRGRGGNLSLISSIVSFFLANRCGRKTIETITKPSIVERDGGTNQGEEEKTPYVLIKKRYAFSPRLFSKAIEMLSAVFKSVSPVNNV